MDKLRSDKMGNMPVPKLLWMMSAPAILSMLVQSLYNVVDSIFVSRISEDALTAVSLAFPLQMLVLAFALGIGVSANSIISRRLGAGQLDEASGTAKNSVFLALCASALFMLCGHFFSQWYLSLFADKDTVIYQYANDYLVVVLTLSVGVFTEITVSKIMQATGNMIVPMLSQLIGAISNIILDYILIFGKLGLPAMGVKGAAVATVIGQMLAMAFSIIMLYKKRPDFDINFKGFKPSLPHIKEIIKIGIPVTVMNSVSSIALTAMNAIIIAISETAVAVLGVYFKLQSFVFMPVFGLNQGAMPIMGYNYGANNKKRFLQTMVLSLSTATVIMVCGLLLFQLAPDKMLTLFDAGAEMQAIGVPALRAISLSFIPAALGIVLINMFQSLGHGFKSMAMSLLRQLVFLLPIALIFSKLLSLNAVWYSYPIAECLTVLIFLPVAAVTIKRAFANNELSPGFAADIPLPAEFSDNAAITENDAPASEASEENGKSV